MLKAERERLRAENVAITAKGEAELVFHGDSLLASAR